MIRGFYTARSGLIAHQEHMSVMANNLANVNTVGFKPMRSAFSDLMYQNLNRPLNENTAMAGHGVKINKNDLMMNQGSLQPTEMELDFAIIDNDGFFALASPTGDISYSRAGNFSLSNQDDTWFLVNGSGDYVLDAEGEVIEVDFDEQNNMVFDPATIGVYRFPNMYGLDAKDGNSFLQTNLSGEAEALENPTLKKGYIEAAAVDIAQEMANVIEASKAFSFSSRMVMVADEIEQTINQLR